MESLMTHILVATVPLIVLVTGITLTEALRSHHDRRLLKKMVAGALKGLSHGLHLRG